jgi:hypothetical protein
MRRPRLGRTLMRLGLDVEPIKPTERFASLQPLGRRRVSAKRRPIINRRGRKRLTPEMIAAWHTCDHHALHTACGLKVWQSS